MSASSQRPRAPIPLPPHVAMRGPPAMHGHHPTRHNPPVVQERSEDATQEATPNVHFAQHTEVYQNVDCNQQNNHEVAVELEDIALGESAISESGHHSDDDDDKSSSERSEISRAPSVEHYNISFEFKKTFREHRGARAIKPYHKILKMVYIQSLTWSYNILLFALGLFLAVAWAVINALVAFIQTWGISPLTRVSLVIVRGLLPIILEPLGMFFKTCATSCGCGAGCMSNFGGFQGRPFAV